MLARHFFRFFLAAVAAAAPTLHLAEAQTGYSNDLAGLLLAEIHGLASDNASGRASFVEIQGSASGPSFQSYRLEYASASSGPMDWQTVVGPVTSPVPHGPLGMWDLGSLSDGLYALRLTVEDVSAGVEKTVLIEHRRGKPPVIQLRRSDDGLVAVSTTIFGGRVLSQSEPAWDRLTEVGVLRAVSYGQATLFYHRDIILTAAHVIGGRRGADPEWTFSVWYGGNRNPALPSQVIPVDYCEPLECEGRPDCTGPEDIALCKLRWGLEPRAGIPAYLDTQEPRSGRRITLVNWGCDSFQTKTFRTITVPPAGLSYSSFVYPEQLACVGDSGGPVFTSVASSKFIGAVTSAVSPASGGYQHVFGNPEARDLELYAWADEHTVFPEHYYCPGPSTIWDITDDGSINILDIVLLAKYYGQTCDALPTAVSRAKCKSIAGNLQPATGEQINIQFLVGVARYYNQSACKY